jgi:PAS domain S-box-containing protein
MPSETRDTEFPDHAGAPLAHLDPARMEAVGRWLCVGGAALGLLGLAGWTTGLRSLTTLVPGLPEMMPNTAVGLCLAGLAAALGVPGGLNRRRWTLWLAAAMLALAIGAATFVEYLLRTDLNIDELLLRTGTTPHPGRPSPPTALAIACLGGAILLRGSWRRSYARVAEGLAVASALTAFTALMGQLLGAGALYRIAAAPVKGVALPTAISLFLTSTGLLVQQPNAGLMGLVTSTGPGGVLVRRLAPVVLIASLANAFLIEKLPIDETPLALAVFGVAMTIISLALLLVASTPINQAHEALELSRARARELIEQAADGIFLADLDGRYTDVNTAGCRMLGCTRDEIVGKTILDLIPPDEVERFLRSRDRLFTGAVDVEEWRLRRKDGSYLPVEVSARILPGGRWQGIVRDISERKRAEEALRLSEAKFSGIIAMSADAIVSIDPEQRITMFNSGAERTFGYPKEEVIGAPIDILIPERFREAHRQHVRRFAAGPSGSRRVGERDREIAGLRKSGEEFPADAAISKIDVAGTQILTVALRDITEQKRVESEQRFLAEAGAVFAASLEYEETLTSLAQLAARHLAELCMVDVIEEDGALQRLRVVCRDPSKAWICSALTSRPRIPVESPLLRSVLVGGEPQRNDRQTAPAL